MNKVCKFLLVAVMVLGLAGCMSDPVQTEFDGFHEVMKGQVVADLEAMTTNGEKALEKATDIKEFERIIKEEVIPVIDQAKEKVEKVEVETEKVKAVKDKFISALNATKEAQNKLIEAVKNPELESQSIDKSNEAAKLMEEFNQAYKNLAVELGYEFEG